MKKIFICFIASIIIFVLSSESRIITSENSLQNHNLFSKKEFYIDKTDIKGTLHEYFRIEKNEEILVYTRFVAKPRWNGQKVFNMKATAYTPGPESCGIYADGFTFTELIADHGVIAVDPREIKLGSIVYVEKYGLAYAADIGGKIKGKRIDLCFKDVDTALKFGIKDVKLVKLY
ncbi:MAG: 3D domain-containing protein [Candidatus Muirbacterium halophilum]|nr:3D domain-containing protein [Candidatus Muirbacterium halophilum]MCK9474694.1 3D domain-containing protein [Candidatus Muirbacterium halophilum]